MKRFVSTAIAMMICAMPCIAGAETTYTEKQLDLKYPELNVNTNTLSARSGKGECIFNSDGEKLNTKQYGVLINSEYGYKTSGGMGINDEGFANADGIEYVPATYGDVYVASAKWQTGIKLAKSTSDSYDYKTSGSDAQFYLISEVDVFYEGTKVGTLDRNSYSGYPNAYGDYIYIKDLSGTWHFYNSRFEESGYKTEYGSSEYESEYKNGKVTYTHCGSGQVAFVPGCTLTEDEVEKTRIYENGQLLNLQGEVIATLQYQTMYNFHDGYAVVKNAQDLCGMIDEQGNEVVPCIYESIPDYSNKYANAVKDGKQGFVRLADGSEQGFKYAESITEVCIPFAFVQDLDGTVIVVSAEIGELPERYADYRKGTHRSTAPAFVAMNADGACGIVDVYGKNVVPFDAEYNDTYSLTISNDGTVVLGKDSRVFTLTYDETEVTVTGVTEGADAGEAADGWTCTTCGKVNPAEAKFCPDDGSPKPEVVQDDSWTCPSCGKTNSTEAKFCPEDGTQRPEEVSGWTCANCGTQYDDGVNFCMNDGTPKS